MTTIPTPSTIKEDGARWTVENARPLFMRMSIAIITPIVLGLVGWTMYQDALDHHWVMFGFRSLFVFVVLVGARFSLFGSESLAIEGRELVYRRGLALVEFLEHATDDELAPLAEVDIVCREYGSAQELVLVLERGDARVHGVVDPPDAPLTRATIARLFRKALPPPGKTGTTLAAGARRRYVIEVSRRFLDSSVRVP